MHRLDSHINDIEPRIRFIFENVPKQEEPSLQQSLSSYGWILLDSWVAWRTLRFLLRETHIDESVNEKWFQTPSSYTASQLKAVWKFTDDTLEFLEKETGKNFKDLIDNTIQGKRNASAHFTKRKEISGSDSQEIKKIFQALSKVFMLYECGNFFYVVCDKLTTMGYTCFEICYAESSEWYNINNFFDSISLFSKKELFDLKCNNKEKNKEYIIEFSIEGCKAGYKNSEGEILFFDVVNDNRKNIIFWKTRAFIKT